jgi:CzcA family heavy metal efflux pump
MLNSIIRFALNSRLLVMLGALIVGYYGLRAAAELPIDVLPDITRPRVSILTECPGLAPEEVEALVTLPLESALNGATGVETIRSSSDIGLSVIQVEFGWNQEIYQARQIVQERLAGTVGALPPGLEPKLAPISSLLGQIMMIGIWSEDGATDPIQLRTLADWTVRKRLMQIRGVAAIISMGGGKQQFQVLIDPHKAHQFDVTIADVEDAVAASNINVAGGYMEDSSREFVIRGIGRVNGVEDIEQIVVKRHPARSVLVRDVARVVVGAQTKRGDSSVNGRPAVVLTVQKQPQADTRRLTQDINRALDRLRPGLPADVRMQTTYEQREFIDHSVGNVIEAIRDGTIFVILILILFLLNIRTTLITLTAIPLSLLTTFLVFRWFGFSINVMTLGGIAVALGELVDDAIVDVENIFKRLKENARLPEAERVDMLTVVFQASSEVRKAILNSTIIVILVFAPLFALSGIEGRLFVPLGVAYIVSILASTVVSLTVTPVLASWLLPRSGSVRRGEDSLTLRGLKQVFRPLIRFSMTRAGFVLALAGTVLLVLFSALIVWQIGKDFLPPFDEGATQANLFLPPGASLENSRRVSAIAEQRLQNLVRSEQNPRAPFVWFTSKSGRAEEDEHVMGVNTTEITLSLNPDTRMSQDELVRLLQQELGDITGTPLEVEQPIGHLIGHMLSGVSAEIGVKLYGENLTVLKRKADEVRQMLSGIDGLTEPIADQQQMVRQLRIVMKPSRLARYGLNADYVNRMVETALRGRVISRVLIGQKSFDLIVRYDEPYRRDTDNLERMPIELPDGTRIPLSEVADIDRNAVGPNTINRENSQRNMVVRVNTLGRDLISAVREIDQSLNGGLDLPEGYFAEMGGQFEAQQTATRRIILLGGLALVGIFVVLFSTFQSVNHVLQILVALPVGFIGGAFGLLITGQTLSIPATVGFISLGGIAIRNGILLMEAYERFGAEAGSLRESIVKGSLDRLAPVLMTTLTTGCALIPLVIGGNMPGKEILYPVATVILGGLITSAIAEYLLRPGLYYFLAGDPDARIS